MRRVVDVGIGILVGLVLALIFMRGRSGSERAPDPNRMMPAPRSTAHSGIQGTPIRQEQPPRTPSSSEQPQEEKTPAPPPEPEVDGGLRTIDPAATEEEKARLAAVLLKGSEEQRLEAVRRLTVTLHRSADGDVAAKNALEGTIRGDPSERVRAEVLNCFWRMPDASFDLYLERLLNDPSEQVRTSAIGMVNRMVLGGYLDELRLLSKMSDRYTKEQLTDLVGARRLQVIEVLERVAITPGAVGQHATTMLAALRKQK